MPVYNREKYLGEAIESILHQTERNFELLILDDGSTDKSLSIAQSYTNNRIRILVNSQNAGISATLNKGIAEARGEFIARMDSDDIALPQRLEKELKALRDHPEAGFVAALINQMDQKGNDKGLWNADRMAISHEQILKCISAENCIANPTVMFRTEVLKKYKYYVNIRESEDWDLWLRMFSAGERVYKINEVLLRYRIHENSITVQYNKNNIYLKKCRIQSTYFLNKLRRFQVNAFDLKVLRNGFLNFLKYLLCLIHPSLLSSIKQVAGVSPFRIYSQYRGLLRHMSSWQQNQPTLYFFFPFYHTGGAEKVHAEILEAIADQKPVVFITGVSAGKGFYDKFRKSATLIDISLISDYPLIYRFLLKRIARSINRSGQATLFGCNSPFYYILLPSIDQHIQCMDLVHAFVHQGEPGPELWSLPVANRLAKRIVISQKLKGDFKALYAANGIDAQLTERIQYIANYTDVPASLNKPKNERLVILYVGRASYEKRVHLVGCIARTLSEKGVQAEFVLVGDMRNALHPGDEAYCRLTGEINDPQILQAYYDKADLLLITSSREGFPLVIMEAMAHGVVPISTDVGGISEHVIPENTGILIGSTTEDAIVEEFVQAILKLTAERERLTRYSQSCHQYALTHFIKQQFTDDYRRLLVPKSN